MFSKYGKEFIVTQFVLLRYVIFFQFYFCKENISYIVIELIIEVIR